MKAPERGLFGQPQLTDALRDLAEGRVQGRGIAGQEIVAGLARAILQQSLTRDIDRIIRHAECHRIDGDTGRLGVCTRLRRQGVDCGARVRACARRRHI
jgi:hypothetical protein